MAEKNSWWSGTAGTEPPTTGTGDFQPQALAIPKEEEVEQLPSRRIHILGMGSIGTLVAHSLRCLPNPPPVTLLMHRNEMYEQFKSIGRRIRLINVKNDVNDEQTGYDVDLLDTDPETGFATWNYIPDRPVLGGPPTNPVNEKVERLDTGELYIQCLIVTVKGPATVKAMQSIKHRVNAQSTICLMQNGMGQIEELNSQVFTDPQTRPTYMLGILSHGAYMSAQFCVVHAGFGTVALGIYRDTDKYPLPPKQTDFMDISELPEEDRKLMYPTDQELYSNLSSRYLLRTLTRSPALSCAAFPYLDLFQLQLEKLSSNCLINAVTALLDVQNGETLNQPLTAARRLLLAEISMVMRGLAELRGVSNARMRFSPERLETLCLGVTRKTAANSSSMREDLRRNKGTEIDYINGYIVKRGEELGVKCVLNYMLMQLVKGKQECQKAAGHEYRPSGTSRLESTTDSGTVTLEERGTNATGRRNRG